MAVSPSLPFHFPKWLEDEVTLKQWSFGGFGVLSLRDARRRRSQPEPEGSRWVGSERVIYGPPFPPGTPANSHVGFARRDFHLNYSGEMPGCITWHPCALAEALS